MMPTSEPKGCLAAILALFGIHLGGPAGAKELPYRQRDDFLSPAEFSFCRVLASAIGGRAVICPKVNLSDVFYVARPNENQAYRNKIDRKHVDFLICDPTTMRPRLGIELDDSSHGRQDRQMRAGRVRGSRIRGSPITVAAYPRPGQLQTKCPLVASGSAFGSGRSATNTAVIAGQRPADMREMRCTNGAANGIKGPTNRTAVLRMPELSEVP